MESAVQGFDLLIAILFRNVRVRQVRPASYGILRSLEFIRCVRDRQRKCQASLGLDSPYSPSLWTSPAMAAKTCQIFSQRNGRKMQISRLLRFASSIFQHFVRFSTTKVQHPTTLPQMESETKKPQKQRFITCSATSILRRSSRHSFLLIFYHWEREIGIQGFPKSRSNCRTSDLENLHPAEHPKCRINYADMWYDATTFRSPPALVRKLTPGKSHLVKQCLQSTFVPVSVYLNLPCLPAYKLVYSCARCQIGQRSRFTYTQSWTTQHNPTIYNNCTANMEWSAVLRVENMFSSAIWIEVARPFAVLSTVGFLNQT